MRLERLYISQNQEYDPYSHTLHPHELLSTQHFEVLYQAKRRKEQGPDEALQGTSYQKLDIFATKSTRTERGQEADFSTAGRSSMEPLSEEARAEHLTSLEQRTTSYI